MLTSLASFPALGGYSASKAAAHSVTQALQPELKAGIDLLAVLPGPIDTDTDDFGPPLRFHG